MTREDISLVGKKVPEMTDDTSRVICHLRHQYAFSVIVPVYEDEEALVRVLGHLRRTSGQFKTEIIVVEAGESVRRNAQVAAGANLVLSVSEPGRAVQMHTGAVAAEGKILVFVHADTLLPENWQRVLAEFWEKNAKASLAAFRLGFDSTQKKYAFMAKLANWRTRWITKVPHGDQAWSLPREIYNASGGFPPTPIMEEYFLARRLKKLGRIRILKESVRTSPRRYEKKSPWLSAFRNLSLIFLFYLGIPPRVLARLYR